MYVDDFKFNWSIFEKNKVLSGFFPLYTAYFEYQVIYNFSIWGRIVPFPGHCLYFTFHYQRPIKYFAEALVPVANGCFRSHLKSDVPNGA